ncbi:MAG: S8 family serine peptidase [Actinomycetes bacterium]
MATIDGEVDRSHPSFEGGDLETVRGYWVPDRESVDRTEFDSAFVSHGTFIASVIFGHSAGGVPGLVPRCRGLLITLAYTRDDSTSELNVARAIEYALLRGARIIHCSICLPSQSGNMDLLLVDALRKAEELGALIIAPAGNNFGRQWCTPAAVPTVLAVGALADDGAPMDFTNFGSRYEGHAVMGPGENVLGAVVGGGTMLERGTSVAAPVLTGIVAALTSALLESGRVADPRHVREIVVATARPCTGQGAGRCIGGVVAIDRALAVLFDDMEMDAVTADNARILTLTSAPDAPARVPEPPDSGNTLELPAHSTATHRPSGPTDVEQAYARVERGPDSAGPQDFPGATPSIRLPALTFALGSLRLDFGNDTVADHFRAVVTGTVGVGLGEDYDVEAMVAYLDLHPAEARRLLWVLTINGEDRFSIEPVGEFGAQAYDMLSALLLAQSKQEVEIVSAAGFHIADRRSLRGGEQVPVLRIDSVRGMYGWRTEYLAEQSLAAVAADALLSPTGAVMGQLAIARDAVLDADLVEGFGDAGSKGWPRLRTPVTSGIVQATADFFNQVTHRVPSDPSVSRERALNHAVTGGYQVATAFLDAMADGLSFASYRAEYSPFARVNGLCWDVVLVFVDPTDERRGGVEYRFTIDVAAVLPVSVGKVRRWRVPRGA